MPLTDTQRKRLIDRKNLDAATRRYNEFAVRKFVRDALDSLDDILIALDSLPERQILKIFKDEDIWKLQALEEKIPFYLDFRPMRTDSNGNQSGYVSKSLLASEEADPPKSKILSDGRGATEQDLDRWNRMLCHLSAIKNFVDESPGVMGNKERDFYYQDLAKDARKKKLRLWKLADRKR